MLPAMLSGIGGEVHHVNLTGYTDTHIVRHTYATRQRRVSDILNEAETASHRRPRRRPSTISGPSTTPMRAEYAQINLGAVLFAVWLPRITRGPGSRAAHPEGCRTGADLDSAVPCRRQRPHPPERNLQESLEELTGRFLPVTDAQYWSDRVGEARQNAAMVAINHARAQILAPHRETDPWAGLDRGRKARPAVHPPDLSPPTSRR